MIEHNFGYERSNLLTEMFGTSSSINKVLQTQDELRAKKQTPERPKKKQKSEISQDYQAGQF